jgi:hypothetical protein
LDQTDFDPRTSKRLDQSAFITAARFANHLNCSLEFAQST